MDIVVRQTGGVFGIDRKVQVRRQRVTVSSSGRRRWRRLESADHETLQAAAAAVLEHEPAIARRSGHPVADQMTTEVLVADDAGNSRSVRFASGDAVPLEIRELVKSVIGLAPHT